MLTKKMFSTIVVSLCLVIPTLIRAGEIPVSNPSQLAAAISSAKPGDVIIMEDGTYKDAVINFNSKADVNAPITIRARTPGKVILSGSSTLTFTAPYLIVDGVYFKEGGISKGAVITFSSSNCRFTNSAIEGYNSGTSACTWFSLPGGSAHNRIDHCYIAGKNTQGMTIQNNSGKYNTIDNCYIRDIPSTGQNGREIFQLGGYGSNDYSQMGEDGTYGTIERNLLYRADGDGAEIVSMKSNYNIIRNNTIKQCRGGIVCRSGNFNTIEGNFILGEGYRGSYGIRVSGTGHKVINNYIADVSGPGIMIRAGEHVDTFITESYNPLNRTGVPIGRVPRYSWVRDGIFANNTIVNAGEIGIYMGDNYKGGWPGQQMILMPANCKICNNIVVKKDGAMISLPAQDKNPPLDTFIFKPNLYQGNIMFGAAIEMDPIPAGIKITDPMLSPASDGIYRPAKNSPAINASVGSYVTIDMDGQPRDNQCDVGADEYSSNPILNKPLTPSDVGPYWMGNTTSVKIKD